MILPYLITAQVARPKTDHIWRIVHNATHLSITILMPDNDPPNVTWVLPNGQRIEGNVIDSDVPAGETLCLCDDFSRCGIDMAGCDPHAMAPQRAAEMPITRGKTSIVPGKCGYLRDVRFNQPESVLNADGSKIKGFLAGKFRIIGSECHPSMLMMTTEEVNKRRLQAVEPYWIFFEVGYAPGFTGDLAKLGIDSTYIHRKANADFTQCIYNPERGAPFETFLNMAHIVIHHTGVHGRPDMTKALPGRYGFYCNPNMSPDDYDQICIELAGNMYNFKYSSMGDSLQYFITDPNEFVLDISNRRTSASDEAVATLRSLGMIVNEIEDV